MPMDREAYAKMRRPVLERAGLHPDAIATILDLERACDDAVVAAIEELSRTTAWRGRRATLARTGIVLVHDGNVWRVEDPK